MKEPTDTELVQRALDARKNAYAPYSKYAVGAALLCADGTVVTGCNVESASYPCGVCAERNALSSAVSMGKRAFSKIAVAGSGEALCTPCGMCRQALYEFAPDLRVLCAGSRGNCVEHRLSDLLPHGFGPASMA